jgi:hypothetical protein
MSDQRLDKIKEISSERMNIEKLKLKALNKDIRKYSPTFESSL